MSKRTIKMINGQIADATDGVRQPQTLEEWCREHSVITNCVAGVMIALLQNQPTKGAFGVTKHAACLSLARKLGLPSPPKSTAQTNR